MDAVFEGLEFEISSLEKLKLAVISNIICSFRLTSRDESTEKWGKGCYECFDDNWVKWDFFATSVKKLDAPFAFLILVEDELVAFVYDEEAKIEVGKGDFVDLENGKMSK